MSLDHIKASLKTGEEPLCFKNKSLNFTLLDFWKWSVSDILSNATRGRLAEFIVATAMGIDVTNVREEWDAYDLITSNGIKLEIKSAAYIQSWYQQVFSKISFSIKLAHCWNTETNKLSVTAKRHADVYVFCLLKHEDKKTINPLNLDHWDFYVLSTTEINNYTRSQRSITLKSLQRLTQVVVYDEIKNAVQSKHKFYNL